MEMALRVLYLVLLALVMGRTHAQDSTTLVPAVITFGDSSVDVGNNNYLTSTIFKANYPPYGRDFPDHKATGRFCNGKLAIDLTAEALGFKVYPPAYLSPEASGNNLLIGANFASAASGYDVKSASLNQALTLPKQLDHFREYKTKLAKVAGSDRAASIVRDAVYILSAGSSDFLQNYYINPIVNTAYTTDQYSSILVSSFSAFVKDLYRLGARKIGVTSLPPLGCFPAAVTFLGFKDKGCVPRVNTDARRFNRLLNAEAARLQRRLSGVKIVVFDIYTPLYNLIKSPSETGFTEVRRGCCGTGRVETTVLLCNLISPGTCSNATKYVFWDAVHPSEAANQVLADAIVLQGVSLVTNS